MFNTILVAFDGSDHASWALNKAIEIAKTDHSSIIVFHSIMHYYRPMKSYSIPFLSFKMEDYGLDAKSDELVYQSHKDLGERLLAEAKKKVDAAGVKCEAKLVENRGPVDAAKELVDSLGIDLVIVGAKGIHNAIERAVLGSVSSGIVNNVCSNVLVMRSECAASHGSVLTEQKKPKGKSKT